MPLSDFSDQIPANNLQAPAQVNNNPSSNIPLQTPFVPSTNPPAPKSSHRWVLGLIVWFIIVLAGGVAAFAYVKKIGPFAISAYTESNFFSNLLEKSSMIDSLSYAVSATFGIKQREADAKPFTVQISNAPKLREQYQNDAERAKNVSSILSVLKYKDYTANANNVVYPTSLKKLSPSTNGYYGNISINDPSSGEEYAYVVAKNGKNFGLKVKFETEEAIDSIKDGYGYVATSTIIKGNEVIFTKDSSVYFYLSPEPPKPFLVSMQELVRMLPPDIDISMVMSASSDLKSDIADWFFNVDTEGNFGDLTYKVNVDALKKNSDYYFRVNNIPSLFISDLASLKGKWIKVPTNIASSTNSQNYYSELSYLAKELPEYEKTYKENRQNFLDLTKQIISIADSEKLILFKKPPRKEKVEDRELTRYELSIRKEAILSFYTKVAELIDSNEKFRDFDSMADQGMVEYLQSQEFSDVFDYYDKNISFTFWADSEGFPAIVQISMRVVPPDTATQLADKQANLIFRALVKDINKPINVEIPKEAFLGALKQ